MKKLLALLVLVPQLVWGAHDFDGSTGWGESSTVEFSDLPITICAWGNADSTAVNNNAATISSEGASTFEHIALNWRGTAAGDPIRAQQTTENGGFVTGIAETSTGYSVGVWHHGCAVLSTTTSRSAYIDGGSKISDTTSVAYPSSLDRTSIATVWGGASADVRGAPFGGLIAEVGYWNVALTDAEVATLAKGYAPPCVRRASLLAYYPMIRDTTSLKDRFSATANNLTLAGTTAVADHPRVINCQ